MLGLTGYFLLCFFVLRGALYVEMGEVPFWTASILRHRDAWKQKKGEVRLSKHVCNVQKNDDAVNPNIQAAQTKERGARRHSQHLNTTPLSRTPTSACMLEFDPMLGLTGYSFCFSFKFGFECMLVAGKSNCRQRQWRRKKRNTPSITTCRPIQNKGDVHIHALSWGMHDVSVADLAQVISVHLRFIVKACARTDVYEQPTWSDIGWQHCDNC